MVVTIGIGIRAHIILGITLVINQPMFGELLAVEGWFCEVI